MTESIEISVVIPVYNSESSLPLLCRELIHTFQCLHVNYEIILVNDNSQDRSWEIIVELINSNINVRGINLTSKQGQFKAILIGVKASKGELILNMDDDLEHPIYEITNLYRKIKSSPHLKIIFGIDREKYHKKSGNRRLQEIRNGFLNIFWRKYPTDSFRIFRRSMVFNEDKFLVEFPMLEIYLKHYVKRSELSYLSVDFQKRRYGVSGYNFWIKLKVFIQYSPYFFSNTHLILLGLLFLIIFTISTYYITESVFFALPFFILFTITLIKRNIKVEIPSFYDSLNLNKSCTH